jgi:hypothetical protein
MLDELLADEPILLLASSATVFAIEAHIAPLRSAISGIRR